MSEQDTTKAPRNLTAMDKLRRLIDDVTDNEIVALRAENKALRSALLKAELAAATRTLRIDFDDANGTATVVAQ